MEAPKTSTTPTTKDVSTPDIMSIFGDVVSQVQTRTTDPSTLMYLSLMKSFLGGVQAKKSENESPKTTSPSTELPKVVIVEPSAATPAATPKMVIPTFKPTKQNEVAKDGMELRMRVMQIVDVAMTHDTLSKDYVIESLMTVLSIRKQSSWNGFMTTEEASTILTFMFPYLSTATVQKLGILLQAPLL
jgi:hypothetical protein